MRLSKLTRNLAVAAALAVPAAMLPLSQAHAEAPVFIGVSVGFAPPVLPVYVQPPLPAPGYIWTPGYWAYGDAGYYWVPGVWVEAPTPGYLWTPGYWGWSSGAYLWHGGYWGPHVGFYGGVNYGFGYGGIGFVGGEWRGGVFAYNSAVANFGGVHVTNVYNNVTVVHENTIVNVNHVSFNGGAGGINRGPSPQESQWANEHHVEPTSVQAQHQNFAAQDRSQLASVNGGRPGTAATSNVNSYHAVAQQHAQSQPISAADRSTGRNFNPSVNQREANQDQHIANGVRSGQLTSGQAARDNQKEANIDRQVANDRAANGGKLTQQEHQQVNHEQNQANRQVNNQEHRTDAAKGAPAKQAPKPQQHEEHPH